MAQPLAPTAEATAHAPHRITKPHLFATLLASVLAAALLLWFNATAMQTERAAIYALAPQFFDPKIVGSDLQRIALQQPDLLPIYGSSELLAVDLPYHASNLFASEPTGFTIFPVGKGGAPLLATLQSVAALGDDLRGKKIVIAFSPGRFFDGNSAAADQYAGNFSHLHAYALMFDSPLDLTTKQAIARHMLQYPDTLKDDSLLRAALEQLADGSPQRLAQYQVMLPVGKLQLFVMALQDRAETFLFVQQSSLNRSIAHQRKTLDWRALRDRAQSDHAKHSDNNPFGLDNSYWQQYAAELNNEKGKLGDATFLKRLQNDPDWDDLQLLLQSLQQLGAQPLLVSLPINGTYYEYWGVSAAARRAYYQKFEDAAKPYGVPVLDFADHDTDKMFLADKWSHPSEKAWVYLSRGLDAFYHGANDTQQIANTLRELDQLTMR